MSRWLDRALEPARSARSGVVVVLDRDGVVNLSSLVGEVIEVNDWWGLRSTYERQGRRRTADLGPLGIVVRDQAAELAIPWDIEQGSAAVVSVRIPGPPRIRAVLAQLDDEEFDRAVDAVRASADDGAAAILRALIDLPAGRDGLSPGDQLRLAARLAIRSAPSTALMELARPWVTDPTLVGILADPMRPELLQEGWRAYVGGDQTMASYFEPARPEVAQLFAAGILEPVVSAGPLDGWHGVGTRETSKTERLAELLEHRPAPPEDAAGWIQAAEWWGEVRSLIASESLSVRSKAWEYWSELDDAFGPWLRAHYGTVLTSAARWPSALHRVAHFLSRRLRDNAADRILLVVLDGLGHAQWAHLKPRLELTVVEQGSSFAMLPTYTTVSRQAIFAGTLPLAFPRSLWTTHPEKRHWQKHWTDEGLDVTRVAYHRVKGRLPQDHLGLGDAQVVGVVVNAVDDLMHSSELLGDAQLLANLDVWAANGFLDDLVARATAEGFETWITADHGNVECDAAGTISEGVAIESAGKRLLRYPNQTLRDASAAEGIVWDDIPGLPPTAEPLLMAPGRSAFTNNKVSISHGGLSLDEVIVPLVRVTA